MAEEVMNEGLENPEEKKTERKETVVEENNVSLEEQLKKLMIENAKLKKASDKASHEAADYKKQLRARQSEDEIALQEKAEQELAREEELQMLRKENQVNKLEKNFVVLGYPEEKAHEAAIAQFDGDTDALFRIQSEVQQNLIKEKEAEWLKSRPQVNAGVGNEEVEITQQQFDSFSYSELIDFKAKYPETYKKYAQ